MVFLHVLYRLLDKASAVIIADFSQGILCRWFTVGNHSPGAQSENRSFLVV